MPFFVFQRLYSIPFLYVLHILSKQAHLKFIVNCELSPQSRRKIPFLQGNTFQTGESKFQKILGNREAYTQGFCSSRVHNRMPTLSEPSQEQLESSIYEPSGL